uniref:C-factor-like n=1 Tax=Leptobrachium leishanense TaxID=445787 RepID=A0A8C5PD99_9ANUR
MMVQIVLPSMLKQKKGAIVNVSCGNCSKSTQLAVYSASKVYLDGFSQTLQYILSHKGIFVQSLIPVYSALSLTSSRAGIQRFPLFIPSSETYARHAVRTLGFSNRTTGYWLHSIQELKKLSEKHGNVIVIQLDATDSASINAAVKQVEKHLNGKNLDLLINNAGVLNPQSLETQTAEDMLQVYNINVVGPMLVTQAFHHLLKRPGEESKAKSAIVHISALLGSMQEVPKLFSHFPVISYRCSKAALNMLSCCHAVGYKQDGILSIAIHPGWVQTDMGGSQAPLTKEESVGEMMKIISSLNETQSGTFVDHTGKLIPW